MIDLSKLNSKRLKAYKKTLYSKLGLYRHKCECCNEMQIDDQDGYDTAIAEIAIVSREQEKRNER